MTMKIKITNEGPIQYRAKVVEQRMSDTPDTPDTPDTTHTLALGESVEITIWGDKFITIEEQEAK